MVVFSDGVDGFKPFPFHFFTFEDFLAFQTSSNNRIHPQRVLFTGIHVHISLGLEHFIGRDLNVQGGNGVVVPGRLYYYMPIAFDQCFRSLRFRYDNFILSVVFASGLIVEIERNNVFYGLLGLIRRLFFVIRNVEYRIFLFRFLLVVAMATD